MVQKVNNIRIILYLATCSMLNREGQSAPKGRQRKEKNGHPCLTLIFLNVLLCFRHLLLRNVGLGVQQQSLQGEWQKYLQHTTGSVEVVQICMPAVIARHNPSPRAQGLQGWSVPRWFMIYSRLQWKSQKLDLLWKSFSIVGYSALYD